MWALLLFFPSFLFAGLVPHVPGACTTRPTRQVWSPLCDLPWPEEPTFWGAWFNAFRSWCRPYYACWILHQQPQRDMEPSLWKLKRPDRTFSNWVRGDYEARKPVFSHLFLMCPPNQCSPSLFCHLWIEVYDFFYMFLWVNLTLFLFRHDCGFHTLEYLAKWEGRRVPVVTAAMVVELRKIYTWNWLMNEDFNTRSNAREFIEEAVKKAAKKYKWPRGAPDRTPTLHSVAEECKVLPCFFKTMSFVICHDCISP